MQPGASFIPGPLPDLGLGDDDLDLAQLPEAVPDEEDPDELDLPDLVLRQRSAPQSLGRSLALGMAERGQVPPPPAPAEAEEFDPLEGQSAEGEEFDPLTASADTDTEFDPLTPAEVPTRPGFPTPNGALRTLEDQQRVVEQGEPQPAPVDAQGSLAGPAEFDPLTPDAGPEPSLVSDVTPRSGISLEPGTELALDPDTLLERAGVKFARQRDGSRLEYHPDGKVIRRGLDGVPTILKEAGAADPLNRSLRELGDIALPPDALQTLRAGLGTTTGLTGQLSGALYEGGVQPWLQAFNWLNSGKNAFLNTFAENRKSSWEDVSGDFNNFAGAVAAGWGAGGKNLALNAGHVNPFRPGGPPQHPFQDVPLREFVSKTLPFTQNMALIPKTIPGFVAVTAGMAGPTSKGMPAYHLMVGMERFMRASGFTRAADETKEMIHSFNTNQVSALKKHFVPLSDALDLVLDGVTDPLNVVSLGGGIVRKGAVKFAPGLTTVEGLARTSAAVRAATLANQKLPPDVAQLLAKIPDAVHNKMVGILATKFTKKEITRAEVGIAREIDGVVGTVREIRVAQDRLAKGIGTKQAGRLDYWVFEYADANSKASPYKGKSLAEARALVLQNAAQEFRDGASGEQLNEVLYHISRIGDAIGTREEAFGRALVKNGVLHPETYQMLKGNHIRYLYQSGHREPDTVMQAVAGMNKTFDPTTVRARQRLTREEQELAGLQASGILAGGTSGIKGATAVGYSGLLATLADSPFAMKDPYAGMEVSTAFAPEGYLPAKRSVSGKPVDDLAHIGDRIEVEFNGRTIQDEIVDVVTNDGKASTVILKDGTAIPVDSVSGVKKLSGPFRRADGQTLPDSVALTDARRGAPRRSGGSNPSRDKVLKDQTFTFRMPDGKTLEATGVGQAISGADTQVRWLRNHRDQLKGGQAQFPAGSSVEEQLRVVEAQIKQGDAILRRLKQIQTNGGLDFRAYKQITGDTRAARGTHAQLSEDIAQLDAQLGTLKATKSRSKGTQAQVDRLTEARAEKVAGLRQSEDRIEDLRLELHEYNRLGSVKDLAENIAELQTRNAAAKAAWAAETDPTRKKFLQVKWAESSGELSEARKIRKARLANNWSGLSKFTNPTDTPLRREQWSILTGENPMGATLTDAENVALNQRLLARIKELGYEAYPVRGHYGANPEHSFLIPGMTTEDAMRLGKEFNQDSVLTQQGLVYGEGPVERVTQELDALKRSGATEEEIEEKVRELRRVSTQEGTVSQADLEHINFDSGQEDFYSVINIGGKEVKFSVPINFDGYDIVRRRYTLERYSSGNYILPDPNQQGSSAIRGVEKGRPDRPPRTYVYKVNDELPTGNSKAPAGGTEREEVVLNDKSKGHLITADLKIYDWSKDPLEIRARVEREMTDNPQKVEIGGRTFNRPWSRSDITDAQENALIKRGFDGYLSTESSANSDIVALFGKPDGDGGFTAKRELTPHLQAFTPPKPGPVTGTGPLPTVKDLEGELAPLRAELKQLRADGASPAQIDAKQAQIKDTLKRARPGVNQPDTDNAFGFDSRLGNQPSTGRGEAAPVSPLAGQVNAENDVAHRLRVAQAQADKAKIPPSWVQVPDTAEFGSLGGHYVPQEMLSLLKQRYNNPMDQFGKKAQRLVSFIKYVKTAMNPATHFNNFVGNIILAEAGANIQNTSLLKQPWVLTEAANEIRLGRGRYLDELRRVSTVFDHTNDAVDFIRGAGAQVNPLPQTPFERAREIGARVWRAPGQAYQAEEQLFKLALYSTFRRKGVSAEDAAELTQRYLFDYSDVPQMVDVFRRWGVSPFMTFPYKATGVLLETVAKRPDMINRYNILRGHIADDLGNEEEQTQREQLFQSKPYLRGKAVFPLPWKDGKGNIQYLDLSNKLPLGFAADPRQHSPEGMASQSFVGGLPTGALFQSGIPNPLGVLGPENQGPLLGSFKGFNSNPNLSDRELLRPGMTPQEQARIQTENLAQTYFPPAGIPPLSGFGLPSGIGGLTLSPSAARIERARDGRAATTSVSSPSQSAWAAVAQAWAGIALQTRQGPDAPGGKELLKERSQQANREYREAMMDMKVIFDRAKDDPQAERRFYERFPAVAQMANLPELERLHQAAQGELKNIATDASKTSAKRKEMFGNQLAYLWAINHRAAELMKTLRQQDLAQ